MNRKYILIVVAALATVAMTASAQESDANRQSSSTTVRGCLTKSRGNYLVVEDKTGLVYALKDVGSKLNGQIGHEVEVTGEVQSGTMKTGVRSTKEGSNPSDTVHGVDGTPLQVNDVTTGVRTVSQHCKAADAR